MIRKITGVMLAFALLLVFAAVPAAGLTSRNGVYSSEPDPTPAPPEETAAPTDAPIAPTDTPAPTPTPDATATPKPTKTPKPTNTPAAETQHPTQSPTQTPAASTTPRPTPTPAPSTGTQTNQPTEPTQPTQSPTAPPSYTAYPLWNEAGETIQKVIPGERFEILLVEGVSEYITFSNFYSNLPATVAFANELDSFGRCSLIGVISAPGSYEFALEFLIRGGRKLMLNFSISAEEEVEPTPTPAVDVFPAAHPLVPFGSAPAAMLPTARSKEDL